MRMSDIAKASGISRQALYLHFPNRAELLIATTRYLDEVKDVDARLAESRSASDGEARLIAFIDAWGSYIPEIYGVGNALMAMMDTDDEARAAWEDRMDAVRQGCQSAIKALAAEGRLANGWTEKDATDMLWALLSVRTWEQLRHGCGWSQQDYQAKITKMARDTLVA